MEMALKWVNSGNQVLFTKKISNENASVIHRFFTDKAGNIYNV
jgi:hypothetical protein